MTLHNHSLLWRHQITVIKPRMRLLARALLISRDIYTNATASLNKTIDQHIRNGNLDCARYIFDKNPSLRNVTSWNMIISGHVKRGQIHQAMKLFDEMPERNVVSWNAMLSGLGRVGNMEDIYRYYVRMQLHGMRPDELTFSIFIGASIRTAFNVLIPQLHCLVTVLGLNASTFVGSALMKGYADLKYCDSLRKVFEEDSAKGIPMRNALISCYMDLGLTSEAKRTFETMPEKNDISWTIMVNGYVKNKKLDEARSIFDQISERCVVLWTAMLSGYVQSGRFLQGLEFFLIMLKSGDRPNHFTYSSALDACSGCSSLVLGKQIHSRILKSGTPLDVILLTSLIDMYAKCGEIETSFYIFESMPNKNIVTWNAIIGSYATHGLATRALEEFERMIRIGFYPDYTTFVNVLSACAHGGLVEEGEMHFNLMTRNYKIKAGLDHYACLVDLYGRAGYLNKAAELIEGMPIEPDVVVWGALVSACGLHSNSEFSEFAAKGILKLEKDHPSVYSMLSRIFSEKGKWTNVFELKKMMKERWAKKQKAGSWIESTISNKIVSLRERGNERLR